MPLNATDEGEMKLKPLMVTLVPAGPPLGEKPLIAGIVFADPLIIKPREMLKKILPTSSTRTRALPLGVPGIVIVSDPSFGVLFARMIGKVVPPSVESVILTFAQLTGARFVLATFQLTV